MIDIANIKEDNYYTIKETAKLLDMNYKVFANKLYKSNISKKLINNRNYIKGSDLKIIISDWFGID